MEHVQCSHGRRRGKPADARKGRIGGLRPALLAVALLGQAACLLAGCSSGEDLVTTAESPGEIMDVAHERGAPLPQGADPQPARLDVTPAQRAFLDALSTAGVHPSSELQALSIGSHVCQAHAAGQSDQAVWDYIAPMVRSDVADARTSSPESGSDVQISVVTANYIRIATQRLC